MRLSHSHNRASAPVWAITSLQVAYCESRVSAKTRERIRKIADELGYRPSRSAQALRSAKTGTIGLLAPNLESLTMDGEAPVAPDAQGRYPVAMPGVTKAY